MTFHEQYYHLLLVVMMISTESNRPKLYVSHTHKDFSSYYRINGCFMLPRSGCFVERSAIPLGYNAMIINEATPSCPSVQSIIVEVIQATIPLFQFVY